jgi:hypothetical protein
MGRPRGRERTARQGKAVQAGAVRILLVKLRTWPGIVIAAVVSAVIAWAIPQYLPGIAEQLKGRSPLVVQVMSNPARIDFFSDLPQRAVVRQRTLEPRPGGEGCDGFHEWVVGRAGADLRRSRMRLVLRGQAHEEVLVTSIRAIVSRRAENLAGEVVVCPSAGLADVRAVTIDLDHPTPIARYRSPEGVRPFALTLRNDEREIVDVIATARKCLCTWRIEIEFTVCDRAESLRLDDAGRPFRTTGPSKLTTTHTWDWTTRAWTD